MTLSPHWLHAHRAEPVFVGKPFPQQRMKEAISGSHRMEDSTRIF